MEHSQHIWSNVDCRSSAYEVAEGASAISVLTEWEQLRALDFERLAKVVAKPSLLDFCNIYSEEQVTRRSFTYSRIGSASWTPRRVNV